MNRLVRPTAWACLGLIVFATLSPIQLRPEVFGNPNIDRLGAFVLLSLLFGLSYPRRPGFVLLLTAGAAMLLEFLQTFTVDRHGHLADMLVKVAGVPMGVLIAQIVVRL